MFEKRMQNEFSLLHDIEARLNRTVCLYDGEPYRIETDGGMIYLCDLLDRNPPKKIDAHDPLLDISAIELGYVNIEPLSPSYKQGFCQYLMRGPGKQWKQGTSLNHIEIQNHTENKSTPLASTSWKSFYDMVKGNYPSVVEAVWNISSGLWESVAISRDVCLTSEPSGSMTVVHMRDPIGTLIPGQQKVYVKDHEYLWCVEKILRRFNIEIDPFKVEI